MKQWYESKTVWLNVIATLLFVAAMYLPGGQFADFFSAQVVQYIAMAVGIVNIILRVWFTSEAIRSARG